ncbi:MAG: 5'-3' exonuclease H3TH domain-containing protein, partial [Patescibacteria group bacterium]
MKRLILIDSHAIIYRAYHALPPMTGPNGEPTHAVYGFTTILLRIIRELKPDYIAAAFDLSGPTFRHIASERYKATRPETPDDLASQFGGVKEVLAAFGIPVFEKEGFEADDVLGTLVKKVSKEKNLETIIVTGDMDALQLVGPNVKVYAMRKGVSDMVIYDTDAVRERYGFAPEQMIDFKALKGDASDNIAGVKGIGEKTALVLIKEFGSVEEIYKQLEKRTKKISSSVVKKLIDDKENAFLSKELATIHTSVPIEIKLADLRRASEHTPAIRVVFQKFGFFGLLKRLNQPQDVVQPEGEQALLFSSNVSSEERITAITALSTAKEFSAFISLDAGGRFACAVDEGRLFLASAKTSAISKVSENIFHEAQVKKFFQDNHFICHDAKSAIHFLRRFEIEMGACDFDTMIASYLTGAFSRDFSYAGILGRELGRPAHSDTEQEFVHIFEIASLLQKKLEAEHM